jgi:hypothetical protein
MIQLGVWAEVVRSHGYRLPEIDGSAVVAPVTAPPNSPFSTSAVNPRYSDFEINRAREIVYGRLAVED